MVKEVDVSKIINNVKVIKEQMKSKLIMVSKANFYSLGNLACYVDGYVDGYAVFNVEEGERLRKHTKKSILVFNAKESEIDKVIDNDLEVNFCKPSILMLANEMAKYKNKFVSVHIPVDTGMNRFGIKNKNELDSVIKLISSLTRVKVKGAYTHLFSTNKDIICKQLAVFDEFCGVIERYNKKLEKHVVSSLEIDKIPNNYYYDYVRIGIGCYSKTIENTKDAVSIYGNILEIKEVKKSESVGYENGYTARSNVKIAVVSGGYFDGVSSGFKGKTACVNHKKVRIISSPCMDVFFVDVTGVKCEIGDKVYLVNSNEGLSINKVCKALNVSMHELLVGFNGRTKINYENISDL